MSHRDDSPLLMPLLALLVTVAVAASPAELADRAVAENPGLDALRARTEALTARADVAGAWSDPVLAVELSNLPVDSFTLGGHPMASVQVRASQQLKPAGWSRLRREVGGLKARSAEAAEAEAALQLRVSVERTTWLLARTALLRDVTRDHLARTEELLAAATARYETGGTGQHGVLRLTVLRDRLADDLADFDRAEAELRAGLRAALGGGEIGDLDLPGAEPAPTPPALAPRARALESRPLLAGLEAKGDAATEAATLARVSARPSVSVWAGYRLRTIETSMDAGTDLVSVGVGVPLPVGSARRADGHEAAAEAEARAADAEARAALDRITAQADAALAGWRRAADKVETYDTVLLPGARATLETTRADFTVGRADFASLFEAEVALLQLERARIGAAVDTWLHRADVWSATGVAP